jgi:hypothetical protein
LHVNVGKLFERIFTAPFSSTLLFQSMCH